MTVVAVRRPARGWDVVRAELGLVASVQPVAWLTLILLLVAAQGDSVNDPSEYHAPYGIFRFAAVMMFLLPLAWQGRGGSAAAVPLPLGDVARALVRVFCGAVCASIAFALALIVYVFMARADTFGMREGAPSAIGLFPADYPVSLTLVGLAHYLLGAAVVLRAQRPGRVLLAMLSLGGIALAAAGLSLERVEWTVEGYGDDMRIAGGTSLTVPQALLRLALGVAAVLAAAWLGSPRARGWRGWSWPGIHLRRHASARPAAPVPIPRGQASAWTVLARHLLLLAPRMVVPLLLASLLACFMDAEAVTMGETGLLRLDAQAFTPLMYAAFLWPVLVWLDEQRIQPWDEARPVGRVAQRMTHAAAGLVWLLLVLGIIAGSFAARAVHSGVLASYAEVPAWMWLGLPLAVVAVYGAGTASVVSTARPMAAGIIGAFFLLPMAMLLGELLADGSLAPPESSLSRMLAPFNVVSPQEWSLPPALAWSAICVGLAAGAIRLRALRDLHGRPLIRGAWIRLARRSG